MSCAWLARKTWRALSIREESRCEYVARCSAAALNAVGLRLHAVALGTPRRLRTCWTAGPFLAICQQSGFQNLGLKAALLLSPSPASAPTCRATIRLTSLDASASMRACAWPGCQGGDIRSGQTRSLQQASFTSASSSTISLVAPGPHDALSAQDPRYPRNTKVLAGRRASRPKYPRLMRVSRDSLGPPMDF